MCGGYFYGMVPRATKIPHAPSLCRPKRVVYVLSGRSFLAFHQEIGCRVKPMPSSRSLPSKLGIPTNCRLADGAGFAPVPGIVSGVRTSHSTLPQPHIRPYSKRTARTLTFDPTLTKIRNPSRKKTTFPGSHLTLPHFTLPQTRHP